MLTPDPDSLIDVAVPDEAEDYDAHKARAGLYVRPVMHLHREILTRCRYSHSQAQKEPIICLFVPIPGRSRQGRPSACTSNKAH